MKSINEETLDEISLGATVLGSGGGGHPSYDLLMAKRALEIYGEPQIATLDEIDDDALVMPIAFAGAPLINLEIFPSGNELEMLLSLAEKMFGRGVTHLVPAEIGGANSLCPFLYASKHKLPIIDADTIGRAFPELQMSTCNVHGISPTPAFLADNLGNSVCIQTQDAFAVEKFARKMIVEMGSSALIGLYVMSGRQAKMACVPNSLTRACHIGKTLKQSALEGKSLESALIQFNGKIVGEGIVEHMDQSIHNGFLSGEALIAGKRGEYRLHTQNEFLQVCVKGGPSYATPDIIALFEQDTFQPITSEYLSFGARVQIACIEGPSIWKQKKGLSLVGPSAFKLEPKGCK